MFPQSILKIFEGAQESLLAVDIDKVMVSLKKLPEQVQALATTTKELADSIDSTKFTPGIKKVQEGLRELSQDMRP